MVVAMVIMFTVCFSQRQGILTTRVAPTDMRVWGLGTGDWGMAIGDLDGRLAVQY